jgi:sarcosine oxidase delta subunit
VQPVAYPWKEVKEMKTIKVRLCPACGECPEVEITEGGVAIGEQANTVCLTHRQWNDLVARVRSGELKEVE